MEKGMWPVKVYADDSGKETPFESLSSEDQAAIASGAEKLYGLLTATSSPGWGELGIKVGEIITAQDRDNGGKVIMFPSRGNEQVDIEIAQRNGIQNPIFGGAEGMLRAHYTDGVMIFRDEQGGVTPPPGADW